MKFALGIWLAIAACAGAAGLEFSQPIKDVHAPADVVTVTESFDFKNHSDKPVTIAKADPTCSCLKVEISDGKLKYAPGESGVMRVTFEMGNFSGVVEKKVAIWLDDDPADNPSRFVTVRVHIPVLIAIEPKTVKWDVGSEAAPQTIQIRMAEGQTIHITGVKSSSDLFSTEIKTLEPGKKYDLLVTPNKMTGPGLGVIRIETDCAVSKHRTQQAFAVVRKP
ncbi:MAG: DUF1573 domain-containing protein [Luteolibacter sp.]